MKDVTMSENVDVNGLTSTTTSRNLGAYGKKRASRWRKGAQRLQKRLDYVNVPSHTAFFEIAGSTVVADTMYQHCYHVPILGRQKLSALFTDALSSKNTMIETLNTQGNRYHDNKLYVKDVRWELTVYQSGANNGNAQTIVDMYIIKSSQTQKYGEINASSSMIDTATPDGYFGASIDTGAHGMNFGQCTWLTPYNISAFTRFYNVIGHYQYLLSQYGCYTHQGKFDISRLINEAQLDTPLMDSGNEAGMRGVTYGVLLVHRSANKNVTGNGVLGLLDVKLDCQVRWKPVLRPTSNNHVYNSIT